MADTAVSTQFAPFLAPEIAPATFEFPAFGHPLVDIFDEQPGDAVRADF